MQILRCCQTEGALGETCHLPSEGQGHQRGVQERDAGRVHRAGTLVRRQQTEERFGIQERRRCDESPWREGLRSITASQLAQPASQDWLITVRSRGTWNNSNEIRPCASRGDWI